MPTVLIVDDVPEMHELLGSILPGAGFRMLSAESAEEALALFEAHQPDIVVADVTIKPSSGYDLLAELHTRDPAAKVVLMSGHKGREHARRAHEAGALAYLEKPFQLREFTRLMQELTDA